MPYNLTFYKTDTAEAVCLAGTGLPQVATVESQSIISQRDVDRKAVSWAKALAQSRLRCVVPPPGGKLEITPFQNFSTAGVKGGSYPTQQYVLTNNGKEDVNWVFAPGASWLTSDIPSGFLYVGESVVLTIGVDDPLLNPDEQYTTLLEILNVEAGVADIVLGATVDVYPVPQLAADFVSQAGTGTLIGYSEYTSPSTPPRKYRVQTLDGIINLCSYVGGTGCSTVNAFSGQRYDEFSGNYTYNAVTAAETNAQKRDRYSAPSGTATCFNATFASSTTPPRDNWVTGAILTNCSQVVTPTTDTWTGSGVCTGNDIVTGFGRASLSQEDTEADAIARATKTPGTSNQARTETRDAGDFTFIFRTVTVTLDSSDLAPGLSYRITLDLLTEDYGGGNGVNSQHTIDFVASGTTQQTIYSVQAPYGKQVTLTNPQIAIL